MVEMAVIWGDVCGYTNGDSLQNDCRASSSRDRDNVGWGGTEPAANRERTERARIDSNLFSRRGRMLSLEAVE